LNSVSFVLTASSLQISRHGLLYVQDELFQANLPVTPASTKNHQGRHQGQMAYNRKDSAHTKGSWLTTGRTVLIQKYQTQGNKLSNYRPITRLLTTWKLLSGILDDRITQHPEPSPESFE